MGKRNLALIGTHQDFFADIFDEDTGDDPLIVTGCASPEDAGNQLFQERLRKLERPYSVGCDRGPACSRQ